MKTANHEHNDNGRDVRARVRKVLIMQYLLHEIQHHALQPSGVGRCTVMLPKAHSLIDIYKCLHQGQYGVAHSIDDPLGFIERLRREIMGCDQTGPPAEPLLESVSAEGRVLRVNLRPFRHQAADEVPKRMDLLAEVCFESARTIQGSDEHFLEYLLVFKELNHAGELRLGDYAFIFPLEAVEVFFHEIYDLIQRTRQVPVLSHSATYRWLNRPCYRVVDRRVLEKSPLAFLLNHSAVV
jgi:hypothetical protein